MTPPIRGRAEEVKIAREFVGALARHRGGVVVIEGPPGIGKTRLLQEFVAPAGKGVRPLFGQGFEHQRTVPFAPLFMATLGADPPVGQRPALRGLDASNSHHLVVGDLQAGIRAAAAQTPIEIVLDDIHWADQATLLAMRSLTASLADAPVSWVFTTRTGAGGPAVGATVNQLARDGARVLKLEAVESTAVAHLVADVVHAEADESLLSMAGNARGNPSLVIELIQGLQEEGRISVARGRASVRGQELPRRLATTMQERLSGLSEDARRMVQVASVLPESFSAGLLAEVLERRPIGLISAVEEAVRADLLAEDGDRLRFRSDLLRQAARQSLPLSLRRAMERDVVTVLLDAGAAPAEVATQLAHSAEVGDRAAIDALRQAAQSLAASDPCTAADISKRALQLLPWQSPERGPLVAETVVLLNQSMRYAEAQQLGAATLSDSPSPQEEADIRLGLSMMSPRPPGQRAEENRRALELDSISDLTRARHLGWLAFNLAMDGQTGEVLSTANAALAIAASTDDPLTSVLAEAGLALTNCADGFTRRTEESLERLASATRSGHGSVRHLGAVIQAIILTTLGLLDEATPSVSARLSLARAQHHQVAIQLLTQVQAQIHLAAGRLQRARAVVESLPLEDRMIWTRIGGRMGMMTLAHVAAHTNDRSLMREVAAQARDAYAVGGPGERRESSAALAYAAWQRGDTQEALRWLTDDFVLLQAPVWAVDLDHLVLSARVAATAGDAGLRAQVLQAAGQLAGEDPGMPLFIAVAKHARAILERDPDALAEAAKSLSVLSRPLLHAAAAEDAGVELARANRGSESIDQLNIAFDTYLHCGATADAQRVGQVLRQQGVSRRVVGTPRPQTGVDSLTDSELKVAHLVATGTTNRDVAQHLSLSPHTVNSHLRNVFAKLDINSRTELGRLINGRVSHGHNSAVPTEADCSVVLRGTCPSGRPPASPPVRPTTTAAGTPGRWAGTPRARRPARPAANPSVARES
jgi:DNA-binding CsgD family transcriptional regulator